MEIKQGLKKAALKDHILMVWWASLTFCTGLCSAEDSMTREPDWFCCVEFTINDAELSASKWLSPDHEATWHQVNVRVSQTTSAKGSHWKVQNISFICQTIIIYPTLSPPTSVFLHFGKIWGYCFSVAFLSVFAFLHDNYYFLVKWNIIVKEEGKKGNVLTGYIKFFSCKCIRGASN